MKKLIFCLLIGLMAFVSVEAQSSREVRDTVKAHGEHIVDLSLLQQENATDIDSLSEGIRLLAQAFQQYAQNRETIHKPITSQEDVKMVFGALFGILNMILNGLALGFAPVRKFVEKYASKSVLAVVTGAIIAIIAGVSSEGIKIVNILIYLLPIMGAHFTGFTILRKKQGAVQAS